MSETPAGQMKRPITVLALVCLSLTQAGAEERVTVGIELRSLDRDAYRELDGLALEKRIVLRLVQEGFAVVAPDARPDILISFMKTTESWVLEAYGGGQVRRRQVSRSSEPPAELHLEIAQKVVELARAAHPRSAPAVAPPPASAPPVPKTRPPLPTIPKAALRLSFESGVGIDALWRDGGVDPLVRLGGRLGIGKGVGLHLITGLAPSSGPSIQVLEWQLQAGAGYRFTLHRILCLEISGLVGVLLHHYAISNSTDEGNRFGFVGSLPLLLSILAHRHLAIELRVAPGLTDEARSHRLGSQIIWTRSAWRVETGASLVWRW